MYNEEYYLDEARTAAEYRSQKARSARDAERAEDKRFKNRYVHDGEDFDNRIGVNDDNGFRSSNRNGRSKTKAASDSISNSRKRSKVNATCYRPSDGFDSMMLAKDVAAKRVRSNKNANYASDAVDRHNRRHPNSSVKSIYLDADDKTIRSGSGISSYEALDGIVAASGRHDAKKSREHIERKAKSKHESAGTGIFGVTY
jgi:hypothetical protein